MVYVIPLGFTFARQQEVETCCSSLFMSVTQLMFLMFEQNVSYAHGMQLFCSFSEVSRSVLVLCERPCGCFLWWHIHALWPLVPSLAELSAWNHISTCQCRENVLRGCLRLMSQYHSVTLAHKHMMCESAQILKSYHWCLLISRPSVIVFVISSKLFGWVLFLNVLQT